nr:GMC oxidoreductase [Phyllobacterium myrsinacearum]
MSRGKISLRSTHPQDPIVFVGNNLTHQDDIDTLVRGIRLGRRILAAPSMQALGFRELAPGPDAESDMELIHHARSIAKTVYHPAGTCKMGKDPLSVVDNKLQVIGVQRLRISDASVMPTLVSGNTNAPCIMIAERCADFLLGRDNGQS